MFKLIKLFFINFFVIGSSSCMQNSGLPQISQQEAVAKYNEILTNINNKPTQVQNSTLKNSNTQNYNKLPEDFEYTSENYYKRYLYFLYKVRELPPHLKFKGYTTYKN